MLPETIVVPDPDCVTVPVPEMLPETVTLLALLKMRAALLLMVLLVPRLPPVPTARVPFVMLISPR